MKNILLITTGGTIASEETPEGLAPALSSAELLHLISGIVRNYSVRVHELFQMDSSNIQPEEWEKIAAYIAETYNEVDGIVLTHGTDTMAYTAAALSFMLHNIPIPVVLTGAQLPITHPLTDGVDNLRCAFAMAASGNPGVFVAFNRKVMLGTRAVKVRTTGFDAFESVNAPYCAQVDSTGLQIYPAALPKPDGPFQFETSLCTQTFLLKLTPGIDPAIFDALLRMNYRGIVIEAFGAGGIHFIRRNLVEKLEQLAAHGVAVVVCSQCLYERSDFSIYQTGQKVLATGVIQGADMTTEATVVKLMWALGKTKDSTDALTTVRNLFSNNFCGEITL